MGTATILKQTEAGQANGRLPPLLLAALGWLASGYLLRLLMSMNAGRAPDTIFCASCEEAVANPSASIFNIPVAGLGLVYFAVIGLLLAVGTRSAFSLATMVAATGAGVGVRLVFGMDSSLSPICLVCLFVHAINGALVYFLWQLARPTIRLKTALSLLFVAAWLASIGLLPNSPSPDRVLTAYESAPETEIPPHRLDPVFGRDNARVRLVVFSSFQCPACKWFNGVVHRLKRQFGDDLSITFKHFPLSRNCNPALSADMQPRACAAAFAAESANRQRLFWPYHDGLYASNLAASEPLLEAIAGRSGLDLARWQSERESQPVQAKVRADAEIGIQLGVDSTPTVFLNGRRVRDISLPGLAILIRHETGGIASPSGAVIPLQR